MPFWGLARAQNSVNSGDSLPISNSGNSLPNFSLDLSVASPELRGLAFLNGPEREEAVQGAGMSGPVRLS